MISGHKTVPAKDIRSLGPEDLTRLLQQWGEPVYRAEQIHQWVWEKNIAGFADMTNLPKALRNRLQEHFAWNAARIVRQVPSRDGSIKYLFGLFDGEQVEGVLIPAADRVTACISSQVGCSLACVFCATGYMKLKRNLHAYEMYEQAFLLNRESEAVFGQKLSNIVYMGMGEPLLNYSQVLQSIHRITHDVGLGMSPRRITLSTAGIAKLIRQLAIDDVRFELAISIHSAISSTRSRLMPINDSNSLEDVVQAAIFFTQKLQTRITLEYIVFDSINDTDEEAEALARLARRFPSKINIIEYNPIQNIELRNAREDRFERFIALLERQKLIVNVRRSRGKDVNAGCGQLALREAEAGGATE